MKTCQFIKLNVVDSTNSYALKNLSSLEDRQIIVADRQTSGRGRLNRIWKSDSDGNVYMSIILKPSGAGGNKLLNIPQYMSIIICRLLENYGVKAEIKWPNDVLVGGQKISGILSEASTRGMTLRGVVLGVGINLNNTEEYLSEIDQPATSLNLLLNMPVDRDLFTEQLVEEFFKDYDLFLSSGFGLIKEEYVKRCSFIGKTVTVKSGADCNSGIAQGIDSNGEMIILCGNQEKIINIGDVM